MKRNQKTKQLQLAKAQDWMREHIFALMEINTQDLIDCGLAIKIE